MNAKDGPSWVLFLPIRVIILLFFHCGCGVVEQACDGVGHVSCGYLRLAIELPHVAIHYYFIKSEVLANLHNILLKISFDLWFHECELLFSLVNRD